jgi:hypothetical protein
VFETYSEEVYQETINFVEKCLGEILKMSYGSALDAKTADL